MSLVIAGYDFEMFYDSKMDDGVFAIADSAITTNQGKTTLLNGFRKVYELETKVWKPNFTPDGSFRNYLDIHYKQPILVGFAGSTLTAQHILNSITGHIEKLRISYIEKSMYNEPIQYTILLPCEKNPLISPPIPTTWDDETFLDKDYENLMTGKLIAEFVEHSINHSLKSVSQYKLDMQEFNSMHTDIFSAIWCPVKQEHEIYVYRMKSKKNVDGFGFIAYTEKEYLPKDKLAVLGIRTRCEKKAQQIYNQALEKKQKPSSIAIDFLNQCIDEVQDSGSKEIDRPISFRKLEKYKITKLK